MTIKNRLRKFGSRFAFEFFVEIMHDEIIKGLRNYLASILPEDVPRMVREGEFPPLEDLDFSAVADNVEHLKRVSVVRLMEYLAEARPDLTKAIQDMGMKGAEYMVKLRLNLLDRLKHPEKLLAKSTEYQPKTEMVQATCDQCGMSWPVPKDEASSIDKCPFCGA